ncbi:hypothetical protein [Chromobacterium vaccinii]|uniref:hypothetical protein n=1 Tax=Chromobacterium vaccinii TaxID=1108595 RepID=UPI001319BA68|nr:hypothetical protein [Chromobacterium vaccinii]
MQIPFDVIAKLLAPIATAIITALTRYYLEARPKLVHYLVHTSAITLPGENKTQVNTHSIIVRNTGKRTANNVRIGHYFLPESYQVFPPLSHQINRSESGEAEIVIPTLVPNEQVQISYLYFPPILWSQINCYTKSDEGLGKAVNTTPQIQPSKATTTIVWALIFIGSSTTLYWVLILLKSWISP